MTEPNPAPPPPLPEGILQFFRHGHLSPELADVSRPFCDLAQDIVRGLPRNPERTVALRKLLEAKDAAVRASLYQVGHVSTHSDT